MLQLQTENFTNLSVALFPPSAQLNNSFDAGTFGTATFGAASSSFEKLLQNAQDAHNTYDSKNTYNTHNAQQGAAYESDKTGAGTSAPSAVNSGSDDASGTAASGVCDDTSDDTVAATMEENDEEIFVICLDFV